MQFILTKARFKRRATAVPNLIQPLRSTVARRLKTIKFDTAHEYGKLCRAGTAAVARHMSTASSAVLRAPPQWHGT